MTYEHIKAYIFANKFWLVFILIIVAGYAVGKDIAQRENLRDELARAEIR